MKATGDNSRTYSGHVHTDTNLDDSVFLLDQLLDQPAKSIICTDAMSADFNTATCDAMWVLAADPDELMEMGSALLALELAKLRAWQDHLEQFPVQADYRDWHLHFAREAVGVLENATRPPARDRISN